jgi:integrase/recombinase XerD
MRFSEGIDRYVTHKNAMGVEFWSGKRYLIGLFNRLGDRELQVIGSADIMAFLNDSETQPCTWRMKYYTLLRFFDFWAARSEMSYLTLPPPRPQLRQKFVPYIYSREEIKALLKVRSKQEQTKTRIDRITMRTFLFVLYGTGSLAGEALGLLAEDIDFRKRIITIRSRVTIRSRQIPICDDLCDVLRSYLDWRSKRNFSNRFLFITKDDRHVTCAQVEKSFYRIRENANIRREQSATYQPRMHDIKCTFAVHRITS